MVFILLLSGIDRKINDFLSVSYDNWVYGNEVLYSMCDKSPFHTDVHEIVGKIWLIGRSYAAAIERRKGSVQDSDDFYYEVVGPSMLDNGLELDNRLNKLREYSYPTRENLPEIIDTHKFLTDLFYSITNLEKRSLASKYLHFHCPQLFYIYDSRASQGIRKYVRLNRKSQVSYLGSSFDVEYLDFSLRMIELQDYVEENFNRRLMPRELDNLLLYFTK